MIYLPEEILNVIKDTIFDVYARRSSKDNEDRQMLSIPGQLADIQPQLIDKYHLKIGKTYKESRSAFKPGRPDFDEMMARVDAGIIGGAISWHVNRFARNYKDGGDFVQKMSDGKLKTVLTCNGFFLNTARDKEYLMNEFTRATRDSDDKSEAVKRGNKTKFFEKRQWSGPAKPGYLNVTNPLTKERDTSEDSDRLPLLAKGIRLILTGAYTPMQVLHRLNNEWGYRTRVTRRQGGKPLTPSSWYKILSDPYLYGLMVRKEGQMTSRHKPMVTKDEFERLQIILGRKGKPHRTKHEFAFKEVLKCGECGGSVTCEEKWQIICPNCKTKFHRGKNDNNCKKCGILIEEMKKPKILHYIHYHCTKKVNKNCSQGSLSLGELEKKADNELRRYEISERFKDWAIEYLNELNDCEVTDRETIRNSVKAAYDGCVKKLDNLLKLKISPQNTNGEVISEEEYVSQRKYLLQEKESLLAEINNANRRINNWLELSEKTFNFACYARYWFAKGDLKTKTQILGALGSNLVIKDRDLLIDGQEHFFLLEKGKQKVEVLAKRLEPSIPLEMISKVASLDRLRSDWLGS